MAVRDKLPRADEELSGWVYGVKRKRGFSGESKACLLKVSDIAGSE